MLEVLNVCQNNAKHQCECSNNGFLLILVAHTHLSFTLLVLLAELASQEHCTSFNLQVTGESSFIVGWGRDNYDFDGLKF